MGCGSSTIQPGRLPKETIVAVNQDLVSEKTTPIKKIKTFEAIKKNDTFLVEKILEEVDPVANLGLPGENYTCLHAAAHHNSFQSMEVLLSWLREHKNSDLERILTIEDSKGRTPTLLAIISDSSETFLVLLNSKLVDLDYKNKIGETLDDICRKHSTNCLEFLERARTAQNEANQQEKQKDPDSQTLDRESRKLRARLKATQRKVETIANIVEKVRMIAKKQQTRIKRMPSEDRILKGIPKDSKTYRMICDLHSKATFFRDADFPTKIESITTNPKHVHYNYFEKAIWKRPNELFRCHFSKVFLFDSIDPHDIMQGILGVCYLLSSLSALAEFPSRLTKLYYNSTSNPYGVYGLKIYIKGIPTEVTIDDYFPCFGDRKDQPLFSKPKGKELWVLLAEKAWAKVYKNFVACESGFMDEALEYLVGTPASRYLTNDQTLDEIWEILEEGDKKNYVLCAGTSDKVTKEMGLIASHAYSIISVHSVGSHRIIKLRNPWGKFEWTGDFSDDWKYWTDELKNKVGYTNADDGLFCMSLQDFKKCFEFYSVCIYHEGWEYSYIEAESEPDHAEYFRFYVDQPCDIYLRIHQEDKRLLPQAEQDQFKYSSGDILLVKLEENDQYETLLKDPKMTHNGTFFGARSIYPSKKFKLEITEPGDYIVRTKVRWRHGHKDKFTLSAYAPVPISFQKIAPVKNFLVQLFKGIGQKAEKKDLGRDCKIAYEFYLYYFYIYLENQSAKTWVVNIKFTKMENLKLGKRFKVGDDSLLMEIAPGQSGVAILKKIDLAGAASYGWEFDQKWI